MRRWGWAEVMVLVILLGAGPAGATARATPLDPADWDPALLDSLTAWNAVYGESASVIAPTGAVIGATSMPLAIHAGLEALRAGGSAADAVIATALTQTVLNGGSWTSYAGMLYALVYESATGRVHCLNAGFDVPREETDPATIPHSPEPSGRTALVGGFMPGIEALHTRFGRLPLADLLRPAVYFAEEGFVVDAFLARFLAARKDVLLRSEEGRRIFRTASGGVPAAGDRFRQPLLAATLRRVAADGTAYMTRGAWAEHFVSAVRAAGGRVTLADLESYRAEWQEPLRATYHGVEVVTLGYPELGSVQLLEGLHLLELDGLSREGDFSVSAPELVRFLNIVRASYAVTYSPAYRPFPADSQAVAWIAPEARASGRDAATLLQRMAEPGWEAKLWADLTPPGAHSDAIVARDGAGNIVVLVHSINTSLWGSTGIFVDGVSIPDPASFQQDMAARAGPGRRLPNVVNPVIVLHDGVPFFVAGAIGNALHECMLQALVDVVDYDLEPAAAMARPMFWGPWWGGTPEEYGLEAVDPGFSPEVLAAAAALGRPCRELEASERPKRVSYWIGLRFDHGTARGVVSPDFNGRFEVLPR